MRALPQLAGYELYYSELSILEALWKIVKLLQGKPREDVERVLEGIQAIRDSMSQVPLTAEAVGRAIQMYMMSTGT